MAKAAPVSPLAPKTYPDIPPIDGVRFAVAQAGIRYAGRTDVMLALFDEGTQVAGVFTRSKCPSAPVDWCRARLDGGKARALLVNSGNANAFTGKAGKDAAKLSAKLVAAAARIPEKQVFLASTGVIGEPLDATKFEPVLGKLAAEARGDAWREAASAIMTTDTYPKLATRVATLGGVEVRIAGVAKGAGMIAPDMATMLSFVFTDAPIDAEALQSLLVEIDAGLVQRDHRRQRHVDLGHAAALCDRRGGKARRARHREGERPASRGFRRALDEVLLDLAHQVVKDGEGARKFVEVTVIGAESAKAAKRIALSIANSPLVKTAVAGEDANWGRVVMAVGKSGEAADRDKLAIWFGDIRVAHKGMRDPDYDEAEVSQIMKRDEIAIHVDIGLGSGAARVWTCDLTKEYVAINGDYRS